MSLVRNATPSILLSRNLCFSKHLGKSVEVSMIVIVCPSVRLGLTMVKFSNSLVRHREMAIYVVK